MLGRRSDGVRLRRPLAGRARANRRAARVGIWAALEARRAAPKRSGGLPAAVQRRLRLTLGWRADAHGRRAVDDRARTEVCRALRNRKWARGRQRKLGRRARIDRADRHQRATLNRASAWRRRSSRELIEPRRHRTHPSHFDGHRHRGRRQLCLALRSSASHVRSVQSLGVAQHGELDFFWNDSLWRALPGQQRRTT
jgi:hypothetical protein